MKSYINAIVAYLKALCLEPQIEDGAIKIIPASTEKIILWSQGEVMKSETLNSRTLKPERAGLFCASIFGPIKNYECLCGRYKGIKKGIICEKCGVEVTSSEVRSERFGHISLATPMVHPYFKEYLASVLEFPMEDIKKIIYYDVNYELKSLGARSLEKFLIEKNKPLWPILYAIPVLPPNLRPIIEVEPRKFACSDLNILYQKVIERNNRAKKLAELGASEIIMCNEYRMLQEAIDALFCNSQLEDPRVENKRILRDLTQSLIESIEDLWEIPCDYSGNGIVIPDSTLSKDEGKFYLPTLIEIYKPVIKNYDLQNAKKYIEDVKEGKESIGKLPEEIKKAFSSRQLLLTYRTKIAVVRPVPWNEEAIALHPELIRGLGLKLGEKIAFHLPLSEEAIRETNSLVGKIVEGEGEIESGLLRLIDGNSVKPLIDAAITGKPIPLSEIEKILLSQYLFKN
jgi:DNA-directed RNA polymerase beta' subunit